jgi:hypothetical protein
VRVGAGQNDLAHDHKAGSSLGVRPEKNLMTSEFVLSVSSGKKILSIWQWSMFRRRNVKELSHCSVCAAASIWTFDLAWRQSFRAYASHKPICSGERFDIYCMIAGFRGILRNGASEAGQPPRRINIPRAGS